MSVTNEDGMTNDAVEMPCLLCHLVCRCDGDDDGKCGDDGGDDDEDDDVANQTCAEVVVDWRQMVTVAMRDDGDDDTCYGFTVCLYVSCVCECIFV